MVFRPPATNYDGPRMPPNVLLVITDQQSRFAQSAAGNESVRTPHLDALSAAGVRFSRAYCAAPVCSPSRASLATGRPPHQTGLMANGMPWTGVMPEMCGHFLRHGYDVGWVGIRPANPPSSTAAGPRFELLLPDGVGTRLGCESDAAIADAAIRYLRRPGRERPFFLGVTLINPHDICYWVMGQAADTAGDGPLPPLPDGFEPAEDEPDFIRRCRRRTHYGPENTFTRGWDRDDWRRYLREYHALTERADAETGRILDALRDAGLEEETLVACTSDHGEGMARHRWVVKLMLWESVVSVPLTLSWPGAIPRGRVRNQLASGLDLLPTLCDYAGLPVPAGVVGRSLRGAVEEDGPGRDYVVTELHPDDQDLAFAARIVVSERHKYAAFSDGRPREVLFDLEADPGETRNLAADPSRAHALATHRRYLRQWIEETGDHDFPLPPQAETA